MRERCIARGTIENTRLHINEYENLTLDIQVETTEGHCCLCINLTANPKLLSKVFKIFKIADYKNLKGQPCIVYIEKSCIKDITKLLWSDYSCIYRGGYNDNEWKSKTREEWIFGYIADEGKYTNIYV